MSEPTGDGNKEQSPEQASGSDFNDPTSPVWADPTAPIPAPPAAPPPPPGAANPSGQPQEAPQATPPAAPPMSNPYAQPPPAQPYGQPTDQYGQPQYGQQYPAYGQSPYATGAPPSNTSAIILTIVSGLTTVTTCVIGIPSLIFAIMALTSNSTDPDGSRKKARTGWIIFAVNAVVVLVAGIALLVILFAFADVTTADFETRI